MSYLFKDVKNISIQHRIEISPFMEMFLANETSVINKDAIQLQSQWDEKAFLAVLKKLFALQKIIHFKYIIV